MKNTETTLSRSHKKREGLLENNLFFHWASFDCKSGFSLTEPWFEKWLVSKWLEKI